MKAENAVVGTEVIVKKSANLCKVGLGDHDHLLGMKGVIQESGVVTDNVNVYFNGAIGGFWFQLEMLKLANKPTKGEAK